MPNMSLEEFPAVTRIIVSYNSATVLPACLDALSGVPTIVVDNQSSDQSPAICRARDDVHLIEAPGNLGYGAGNNLGLANCETPYVLIINPDAVLDAENLEILLTAAATYPEAALIAPCIINADGSTERTDDRALHRRVGYGRKRIDPRPEGPMCSEFLSGAVLLARTDILRSLGGFDERFFLFYEDDDLSWRVIEAGYSNVLVPAACAIHTSGTSSTPSLRTAYRRDYHMGRSLKLYRLKHLGPSRTLGLAASEAPILLLKAILRSLSGGWVKASRDWGRLAGLLSAQ
ncbi:MAG: glycosyltransferase family 2 protein [Alphaproteobacteria bacterium]|nr:glycosyltransferase family 2 protein [Alphaproteobacteria bacterium]MBL6951684.1 glycosyltransferase family 2 protein [Alphaproteobacteria bacterium]